jgi:hypothetical protein
VDEADGTEGVVATRTLWSIFAVKSGETQLAAYIVGAAYNLTRMTRILAVST